MTLPFSLSIRPALSGVIFPPVPRADMALLFSLCQQLEQTQWLTAEQLRELQFAQLTSLVQHARETVPYYRTLLAEAGVDPSRPLTPESWSSIPVLTRRAVQDAGRSLASTALPRSHGKVHVSRTSGSTGQPVEVHRSGYDLLMWQAVTLRDHSWHRRDLTGKLCSIRGGVPAGDDGVTKAGWGGTTDRLFETGSSAALSIGTGVNRQAAWLTRHAPDYLLTYPSNLGALVGHLRASGSTPPRLKGIQTIGEVLPTWLRDECAELFGFPPVDLYSSQEVGNIALQCPDSGLYHVQSESLLVEVVDESGRPCASGETGRILVTTLHGFAMPLLRYELRDFAEVGPPCSCGRGLPTLSRIYGRVRNMITMPDGEKRWPLVGFAEYRSVAPVRQYQLVQKSIGAIEMRLVVDRPLEDPEKDALCAIVRRSLGHPFEMTLVFLPELPVGPNGKFEEFVSEI